MFTISDLVLNVGDDELAQYLTAPQGHNLGLYADGTVNVGDSVGMEIDPDERPVAVAKCPGIGNIDVSWFRNGRDCKGLTDEEVIADCCQTGDVDGYREDLRNQLSEDALEDTDLSEDDEVEFIDGRLADAGED